MDRPAGRARIELLVVATAATMVAAVALQLAFLGDGGRRSLSDVPHLVMMRGISRSGVPYLDRVLEYPVLAGALLYGAVSLWPNPIGALVVVAIGASACCIGVTVALTRRYGARAWRWAVAIPLVLYAFQNWDAYAVAALVVGLLAFERGHDGRAGVALGLGAAIKLFPVVVVPVLVAHRWAEGRRAGAGRLVVAFAATFAVINLPIAALAPHRWWWTYSFQSARPATWGSAWFYLLRRAGLPVHGAAGAHLANVVSLAALVLGVSWVVVCVVRRGIGPQAAAAAAVAVFVLANKVYSPTYDLWLVVFFVMLPLSRRLWVTFCAVDLAVFVTVYGYFHHLHSIGVVHAVLPVLVLVRTVVLLVFVARATAAPSSTAAEALTPREAKSPAKRAPESAATTGPETVSQTTSRGISG
jgi:uncharacterized membrane protein